MTEQKKEQDISGAASPEFDTEGNISENHTECLQKIPQHDQKEGAVPISAPAAEKAEKDSEEERRYRLRQKIVSAVS